MADEKPRVLVTGSGGLIGSMLIRTLGDRYQFSGLDRTRALDGPDVPMHVADVSDLEAIEPAFEGQAVVIHLAADAGANAPWSSVLPNNIIATRNLFEASRRAGVRRVVFASSNHAVGMFEMDEPYVRIRQGDYSGLDPTRITHVDHTVPVRPDGDYGISKVFGEAVGRYYWERFGIETACLRIGTVNRHNDPTRDVRHMATWCSHRDLAQLVDRCLRAPHIGFDIFYGVSGNKWRFWDTSHAAEVLGYKPEDNAETYR